jgi:homoserine dehydrogenase
MTDVKWSSDPLVSPEMAAMSEEAFMSSGLTQLSAKMQTLAASAKEEGKRLVFVGSIDVASSQVSLGVQAVSKDGPFGSLSGANNIALIWSDYYSKDPLVVMGPGAGAKPTASGVVSDVLRPK